MIRTYLLMLFAAACALAPFHTASAVDASLPAAASFRQAIALTISTSLDFTTGADIEFTGNVSSTDYVRVATDGTRTANGGDGVFTVPNATAQPGIVNISASPNENVSISCSDNVTLEDGDGDELVLSDIEFNTAGGISGNATDCEGTGVNPATYAITGTTDAIHVGGRILSNSGDHTTDGDYSTATSGDPIIVTVVYQ